MLPILIGLGVLIGGVAIIANWDELVNWFKDFLTKLKAAWNKLVKAVAHGAIVVIKKITDYLCFSHKQYYKEQDQWMEKTTTRKVSPEEVPAHIRFRAKTKNKEYDITEEMEEELQMEIS